MDTQYTILTSGSDPADTLTVVGTVPTTKEVFRGSIKELQARIANYPAEIQRLQDAQAADEALLASITGVFTAAGVTDVTAPVTPDLETAINTQNDTANATILQAQVDTLSASITTQGVKTAPAVI